MTKPAKPLTYNQRVDLVAEEINRLVQMDRSYPAIMDAARRAIAALDAGIPPKDCHDCGEGEHGGPWCGLGANLDYVAQEPAPVDDPWAAVPEVGTIAYYRYIGDREGECRLLSRTVRAMARRASTLRRAIPSRLRAAS